MSKSRWKIRKRHRTKRAQATHQAVERPTEKPRKKTKPSVVRRRFAAGWKKFWGAIVCVSVIVGLLISYCTFVPKISVTAGPIRDPQRPFENPFILVNNSLVSIYSVHISSSFVDILDSANSEMVRSSLTVSPGSFYKELKPGDETTIGFEGVTRVFGFHYPLKRATAELVLYYHLPLYSKEMTKVFRFVLTDDIHGNQFWLPEVRR